MSGRMRRHGEGTIAEIPNELAELSADSEHLHAETAGHSVQLDQPDLVSQAIHDLVRRCGQGS
jgi:pimeloyl-ACP methyl ester carboxylesterase